MTEKHASCGICKDESGFTRCTGWGALVCGRCSGFALVGSGSV